MGGVFSRDCLAEGSKSPNIPVVPCVRLYELSAFSKSHPSVPLQHFKTNARECYLGFLKIQFF